jgi:Lsr2
MEQNMARKVQVLLEDDIDGTEAAETVSFSLDGRAYEIDLSAHNAAALRESLSAWIGAARRVEGRQKRPVSAARPAMRGAARPVSARRNSADIREWARAEGIDVSDRGRIASEVLARYEAAH